MKILLINKFIHPCGGDASLTLRTGELLSQKGHETAFWSMRHPLNPPGLLNDHFVSHVDLNAEASIIEKVRITARILYSFEAVKMLESALKVFKPDIAHLNNIVHQISPSIIRVFNRRRIPVVMTLHDFKPVCASYYMISKGRPCGLCRGGAYYHCLFERCVKGSAGISLVNTLEMYLHHRILGLYKGVKAFISPSIFLKKTVEKMGFKGEITHIPNFIFARDILPDYESKERSIVYFGRISKEKGLETLIDAVRGIEGITLKIIGDGPLKQRLEERVAAEGLKHVVFLGFRQGPGLYDEIKRSMFVVLPSEWYENQPFTVIESFALGKPVIGSRTGGIPELVKDNETGLLFDMCDAKDLKAKISYLADRPEAIQRMGRNGRRLVEQEFDAEAHYAKLIALYGRCIG